jgi:hypothetical protein
MKNLTKKSLSLFFILMFFVSQLKCMDTYADNSEINKTEDSKKLFDLCKQLKQCLDQEGLSDEETISTALFIWECTNSINEIKLNDKIKFKPFEDLTYSDLIFFTLGGDVITTAFSLVLGTILKYSYIEKTYKSLTKIEKTSQLKIIMNLAREISLLAFIKKVESLLQVNCYKMNRCIETKNKIHPDVENCEIHIFDLGIKRHQYTHQIVFLQKIVKEKDVLDRIKCLYQLSKSLGKL